MVRPHRRREDIVKVLSKGIALGPPGLDPAVVKAVKETLDPSDIAALGLSPPERRD
jgi:hypothetical protein